MRVVRQRVLRALPPLVLAVLLLAEALGAAWLRAAVETSCELFSNNPPLGPPSVPMDSPSSQ